MKKIIIMLLINNLGLTLVHATTYDEDRRELGLDKNNLSADEKQKLRRLRSQIDSMLGSEEDPESATEPKKIIKFKDVAGATQAKEELVEILNYLNNPETYSRLGAEISRGVLLQGPPGTGKTLLAQALAGETNCTFFEVSAATFITGIMGGGPQEVKELFTKARKAGRSIIFIDEIDSIGVKRNSGQGLEHTNTLNQLLIEMSKLASYDQPVIVIAATNRIEELDAALLRPGRFDLHISVDLPDAMARQEILGLYAKKTTLAASVNIQQLAQKTKGLSGAELAYLVNRAALLAARKNLSAVTIAELEEAHKMLMERRVNPNSQFLPITSSTTFKDVAGAREAKEELQMIVEFLKNPHAYQSLGATVPHGILFEGTPGNGKTLLARALAGEAGCAFFSISASEFVEQYVGLGASRVRELFHQASQYSPAIIFIDEIDAIGVKRGTDSNQEYSTTLNQLLTAMDGFQKENQNIIVIGATNRIKDLDPALLRSGRFDLHITVPAPDLQARQEILALYAKKIKTEGTVDINKLAALTEGFAAADLANLINRAAVLAARKKHPRVTEHDLLEAYTVLARSRALSLDNGTSF